MSAPAHWPGLFVLSKNCGVKFVWQTAQLVWKLLLSAMEHVLVGRVFVRVHDGRGARVILLGPGVIATLLADRAQT